MGVSIFIYMNIDEAIVEFLLDQLNYIVDIYTLRVDTFHTKA